MKHDESRRPAISRRGFLKTSAAVGVAAAAGSSASLVALAGEGAGTAAEETVVQSCCRPGCVTGCRFNIHVRDGKVVKLSLADMPDPVYKRGCQRGLSHIQAIYSPMRVQYPMKRVGERGSGEWERISWDQAIDEISRKILEVTEEHGSKAVAVSLNGGQVSALNGASGSYRRLMNGFEMQAIDNCVDWGCIPGMNRVYGSGGLYGMAAEVRELENADTFVLWACNLTVSNWDRWQHMMRAIDNGAKLIVVDPVYTAIASKADWYIPVRPGSDGAFYMGMINHILETESYDREFILRASTLPFLVDRATGKFLRRSQLGIAPEEGPADPRTGQPTVIDPYLVWDETAGTAVPVDEATAPALEGAYEVNGAQADTAFDLLKVRASEYTPEAVSELCEVSAEDIRRLADVYAEGSKGARVCNFLGFGSNSYDNGPYAGHAMATLLVLTHNIGRLGTNASYNQNSPVPGISLSNVMYMFPDMKNMTAPSMPLLILPELMEKGQMTYDGKEYVAPKVLISAMVNLYNNYLNTGTWDEKIYPNLEMYVVIDRIMNDCAEHADYVLPAAHFFEEFDIRPDMGSTPYSIYCDKAIDPVYEAKPDWEIAKLLAEALGVGQYFEGTAEEHLAMAFEVPDGPTVEQLKQEGVVRTKGEPLAQPYDIDAGNIQTASKRFEIYCETPVTRGSVPLEGEEFQDNCLPCFKEPRESWPTNDLAQQYPLQLVSHRNRTMVHSQYGDVKWLREIDPEPTVFLNPVEAEKRSVTTGDYVRVFNDRGEAVVKLVVSDGVRPGIMMYPKGWLGRFYKKGNMNALTPTAFNHVTNNHSYTDSLVEIEKWEEE